MIIYKCKMCGGNLSIQEGSTITTCEYCRTQQTVPSTDDEKRINLFNRANQYRQSSEFDKAMGIYEHILAEDSRDAEAYWAITLCRFGIEYVEDPGSRKQKPTINRTQAHSILQDADYLLSLEYADYAQRELYVKQAEEIDEIQKGIWNIAKNESPYDVFISYKEKGSNGDRTKSSVLAQNLYNCIKAEGYRVFFSRISLEDKVGQKYEPYIYSALNSAKVMLVVGTDRDEFVAPWVHNEWSRFLTMMRNDAEKILIPCFRDIDIDDLPNEFQILQAQDMSKIGFEQDLLRGIEKVIRSSIVEMGSKGVSTIQSLDRMLQNADIYMKLRNYESSYEVYSDISKYYPEDYRGWWGLIVASTQDFQISQCSEIKNEQQLIEWFSYVKELAGEGVFQEKLQVFTLFWEALAESHAVLEIQKVEELIKYYQRDIARLEGKMSEIAKEEAERKGHFLDSENRITQRIEETDLERRSLKEKVDRISTLKMIGWTVILVYGLTCLILVLAETPLGAALFWTGIIIVPIIWKKITKMESVSVLKKQIDNVSTKMESLEKERDKVEKDSEQEIKKIRYKRYPVQAEMDSLNQKIKECRTYIGQDRGKIANLMFSMNCNRFGKYIERDQQLWDMRNKVWENQKQINTSMEEKLNIPCYVCKNMNSITVSEIRRNNNSFKCMKCGQILHVRLKSDE